MTVALVTVFGGTGFLGREIVSFLAGEGVDVRVAVRHPKDLAGTGHSGQITQIAADVRDPSAVEQAIAGASAVINAIGLYREQGADTFQSVHVEGARNVALAADRAGVGRLVHVSGIGANPGSPSPYVRARGEGEIAACEAFSGTTIVRPSALFGPGDALLQTFDAILRVSPVIPMFGRGESRLQPVYVGDVAAAVSKLALNQEFAVSIVELGGPRTYSYRGLFEQVQAHRSIRRMYLPVPFPLWMLAARILSPLPRPPLTVDQVVLVREDNIVGESMPSFSDLGITPRALDDLLGECLP